MTLKHLVITDVTRMGDTKVCVAGYCGAECVRPLLRYGALLESWLYDGEAVVVQPFNVVEINVDDTIPPCIRPHIEDRILLTNARRLVQRLSVAEQKAILNTTCYPSVNAIFGATLVRPPSGTPFIRAGEGDRSLGTVRVLSLLTIEYARRYAGKLSYRLKFEDEGGLCHWLTVTDLSFRYSLDFLVVRRGKTFEEAARAVFQALHEADSVYLRIGLARPWVPDGAPQGAERGCYRQINGVYSFPDYLHGGCFKDFALSQEERATLTLQPRQPEASEEDEEFSDVPF